MTKNKKTVGCLLAAAALGLGFYLAVRKEPVNANESATMGDVRSVMAAEGEYHRSVAKGFYAPLFCLGEPSACVRGSGQEPVLDVTLVSATPKSGYHRAFHPGPRIDAAEAKVRGWSPSHVRSWAYTASPFSDRSGKRHFCGDSTGRLCTGTSFFVVTDGACPAAPVCTDLR